MITRLFIRDYALINALGSSKREILSNWQQGQSPGMRYGDDYRPQAACHFAGLNTELVPLPQALSEYDCRNNRLLQQLYLAQKDVIDTCIAQYSAERLAIVFATSTSGIASSEAAIKAQADGTEPDSNYHFKQQLIGTGAECLAKLSGVTGPRFTISTACSSSANALATARRLLAQDLCDAAIVAAADTLCHMTVGGFSALESVSEQVCQPGSINRNGITLGEAGGLFIIDKQASDIEVFGVGCSSDAHHISAPQPNGEGAVRAMQAALKEAPFDFCDVDYINLHGTATPLNDAMESKAVAQLFPQSTLVSSSKSLTGHTLGAAAATELGLCCLLLEFKTSVPAQVWDRNSDPELPELNIADHYNSLVPEICLSNSFAFGGNNTSIAIGLAHES